MSTNEPQTRTLIDELSSIASCDHPTDVSAAALELFMGLGRQYQQFYVGVRCGEPSFVRPEYVRTHFEGNE